MTTPRDPDSLLSAYLTDGIDVLPDRVVDAVLGKAHRTRQRVVFGPRRTPVMNSTFKVFLAAAAVIAVVVAGITFLPRNEAAVGGPSSAPPSASPVPSPSGQIDRMIFNGTDPGVFESFSVDLPEGWENNQEIANNWTLGGSTSFLVGLVDNTFEDPCAQVERDPRIGPTVEDLVTALGEIPGTTATEPVQTTIAGYDATYIEVALPGPLPCEQFVWYQSGPNIWWWAIDPYERFGVWIFEVDGRRIAIGSRSNPDTTDEEKAELRDILDTIVFDSPTQPTSSTPAS